MIKLIKELIPNKATPVFVGVSMGIDSLAAFYFLRQKGYNVRALHFNHKLRPQNDLMQEKFNLLQIGYSAYAKRHLKTENDCREARFEFFKNATFAGNFQDFSSNLIITAHHLNDYNESYLLNCFRGQPEYKPIRLITEFPTFKILHPFLLTEKQDFIDFIQKSPMKSHIIQDETNSIIKGSRRNWIRNNIVPEMIAQKVSLNKRNRLLIQKDIEELNI